MGIPFPEEYGGGGADTLTYALAVEELARIDSSVAITMAAHTSLGTMPIYLFGQRRAEARLAARALRRPQARRLRPDRARGRLRRRQRPHHGPSSTTASGRSTAPSSSSPTPAPTSPAASRSPPSPARTRTAARRSRTSSSPTAPPATSPASRTGRWAGTPPTRARSPSTTAACPRRTCSGRRGEGFKQFLQILDGGRIGVAAMGVGLAQGALDEALAYAKERQAFGQPISKFQTIQAKIADLSTEIEAARLLTYKAAILEGPRRVLHPDRGPGEAEDRPARGPRHRGGGPDPRRLRLHRGVPGLPLLPRRQDPHDRRGHRRGPADGDRPPARLLSDRPAAGARRNRLHGRL